MNYLISEEELIGFINKITKLHHDWFVGLDDKDIAKDFLKSKQPVTQENIIKQVYKWFEFLAKREYVSFSDITGEVVITVDGEITKKDIEQLADGIVEVSK